MSKTLYLVDSIDGKQVSSSCHLSDLLPYIKEQGNIDTIRYNIDFLTFRKDIEEVNAKADIVFIVHDFHLWNENRTDEDNGMFSTFLRALWNNKNIFVFPTELASASLIKTQLRDNIPFMTKIIVSSESFRKMFMKPDFGPAIPANKIKLINIPTHKYPKLNNLKFKSEINLRKKLIMVPGLLHPQKDYLGLLRQLGLLTRKYKNIVMALVLNKHPTVSDAEAWSQFEHMQDYVEANNLQEYVRLILNQTPRSELYKLLQLADLIVFPQDNSRDMYNGALVDSLAMGKAIVCPESLFAEDLVKKTGILLYRYNNDASFYDACSVILENVDFRSIIEEQNHEYGSTLAYNGIAQQYINQIKRFKFN